MLDIGKLLVDDRRSCNQGDRNYELKNDQSAPEADAFPFSNEFTFQYSNRFARRKIKCGVAAGKNTHQETKQKKTQDRQWILEYIKHQVFAGQIIEQG